MFSAGGTHTDGQQTRDAFRKVKQAVVIFRTPQRELAPFPQPGMASLNGLGSGVLISNDGKVLTAAHFVQAAERIECEFPDIELISQRGIGSCILAYVA